MLGWGRGRDECLGTELLCERSGAMGKDAQILPHVFILLRNLMCICQAEALLQIQAAPLPAPWKQFLVPSGMGKKFLYLSPGLMLRFLQFAREPLGLTLCY